MKRGICLLLLVTLLVPLFPAAAQGGDCPGAPDTRLADAQHGLVMAGQSVDAYTRAGGGDLVGTLTEGTLFQLQGDPTCVNGTRWWPVTDGGMLWHNYIPESIDGAYVIEPFRVIRPDPVVLGVPMTDPVISNPQVPLPAVIPAERPASLEGAFAAWDWESYIADSWQQAPDPLALDMPDAYAGDFPALPVNLDDVDFVVDAGLNAAQLALLAQNGFVVVPGGLAQFDDVYRDSDRPWPHQEGKGDFITTDALLHSLYLTYENALRFLEQGSFYVRVANFTGSGLLAAQAQWREAIGTPVEEAAYRAAVYYAVPVLLLGDGEAYYLTGFEPQSAWQAGDTRPSDVLAQLDPALLEGAQPIVDLIRAAEGRQAVPILEDYEEDFSQYQVRGYYAGDPLLESYFRAVMWLGRITFTLKSAADTQTGLLVLRALQAADGAYAHWQTVTETLTFLVGPVDDLGPEDYAPLAESVFGAGLPLAALSDVMGLTRFREQANALPGPRVNSIVLPAGITAEDVDAFTRGFRLFGQRFTFDGYAMQQLIYPEVGDAQNGRALPLGLDVAAVLGSDIAYSLADTAGATAFLNYTEHVAALRDEVNTIQGASWLDNLNGGWLWALQPLLARDPALYPPLMQTDAWHRKDIQTMLGSWTQLKHATVLYAEQPMGGMGGGGMTPPVRSFSIVEPNPEVFARISIVAALLRQGLLERELVSDGAMQSLSSALYRLSALAAQLAEMARKELAGEALTHDELYFLQENFGDALWHIRYEIEIWIADPPDNIAIVTDVASNPAAGTALLEGIGLADYIYVVANSEYGLQLTRGAVYSTYEFVNPIDQRLTDDEWRARVAAGDLPPRPDWIDLFYSE